MRAGGGRRAAVLAPRGAACPCSTTSSAAFVAAARSHLRFCARSTSAGTGLARAGRTPRRHSRRGSTGAGLGAAVALVASIASGAAPALAQAGDAAAGQAVYERKCMGCHGEKGDGKGPAAELLDPKPRDLTSGIYKIRTTSTKMPSDQDVFRIITEGMPGTSMPPWGVLSARDRWNVIAYIKSFASEKFKEAPKKLELPKEVGSSAESIKRGREMFEAIECNKCHGADGRADGPSRDELKDEWGQPIKPANLTKRWTFRGGPSRAAIAMRLAAGVLGTPMPAFLDSVEKPDDIWHLANYLASLGPEAPAYATLLPATAVGEAIPDDPKAELWKKMAGQDIPLMGQVIADPRNFNPSIDLVTVRAVYNDREIAFHLTWDDPTESKPDGKQTFADAIALQFPPKLEPGGERPYFLMGDASEAVYQLRWDSGKGVSEVTANGPTKVRALAGSEATGKAAYANGQYQVVIKRALGAKDASRTTFRPAVFTPIAFQAWDGGAGETGTKLSLTSWYYLRLEEPQSKARLVVPPVVALLALGAMLVIVWAANRRGLSVS
jgi:DMSO reductase family type II enzyme heme b subunit